MELRRFKNSAAQGDIFIRRIDKLPDGVKQAEVVNGKYIIAHSETQHHHTMLAEDVVFYYIDDPLVAYLEVKSPTPLEHERPYDTHEPILFDEGIYEIRRQREYTPQGFRRVMD